MDLTELLTAAVEHIPGAVAISLVGMDGVAVETVNGPKPMMGTSRAAHPAEDEIAAWEVEVADLMLGARRAARSLNWGALKSLLLETRELTFMMRLVKPDYFLLLALDNAANVARARFELQRLVGSIGDEL
jgi:predicted regulator of Ras-like GTPase activity (Roadblock/LC7/MglB family)